MTRHISSKWRPKPPYFSLANKRSINETKFILLNYISWCFLSSYLPSCTTWFPFFMLFWTWKTSNSEVNSNFIFPSPEQETRRVSIHIGVSHQDGNLRSPQWKFFQQACTSFSPRPKMAPIQANKWMNREAGAYIYVCTYVYARPISAHIVPQYQC